MNLCILIPLIVGLICAWLGYLLGKLLSKNSNNDQEVEHWKSQYNKVSRELQICKDKNIEWQTKAKHSSQSLKSQADISLPFNAVLARTVFGKTIKQDDLTIIEGIGPKISSLFVDHGITTWKLLSEASVEKCQKILDSEGERYSVHNPGTWPRQAKLAYEGKWQELLDWQDILDGGKE
ncbi:hypothetical protein [Membranihabitans marinus]|uniref:hypothetical protein n=1 Tax=Membranihabitans marinus TaxID=1227546 RepID=UPI001F31FA03|nr:hypothetical protein [Membranihabitans marinus]